MAFIRKRGGCFQLVETYRDGGKVHQRLIATLGSNAEPETALAAYQAEFSEHHYRTPRITRRRERLALAGNVQLLTWIPATLRRELDRVAAARGEPLSETTTALLTAALKTATTPATRDKPTAAAELIPDMFLSTPATTTDKAALMTWVGELLNEGHTGADIARQLNASGQRTAVGTPFNGGNLLRDYRAWLKKTAFVE